MVNLRDEAQPGGCAGRPFSPGLALSIIKMAGNYSRLRTIRTTNNLDTRPHLQTLQTTRMIIKARYVFPILKRR